VAHEDAEEPACRHDQALGPVIWNGSDVVVEPSMMTQLAPGEEAVIGNCRVINLYLH
jgi:hypothetical protein